jgi:hypothetical protein
VATWRESWSVPTGRITMADGRDPP